MSNQQGPKGPGGPPWQQQPQQGWPQQSQQPQQPQQPGWQQQPQQPGYPQQAGYPPQQPGYPPQQRGYPPQQPGYPPQQPGYPPQQPGYPPQQPGYPPQQPGYPPQQPGYPPQHGFAPPSPPPSGAAPLPHAQAVQPGAAPSGPPAEAGMFKRSLGRAVRLRIEPNEISPSEHRALTAAGITDPYLMAFLAWRRSLLFLVAVALIPLTVLRLADGFSDDFPEGLRFIVLVPAAAEALLCVVCWYQLRNWTRWKQQRKALQWAWFLFMAAPFLVFLVPIDTVLENMIAGQMGAAGADAWGAEAGGAAMDTAAAQQIATALKVTISIYALLTLAPKAVSLLAGTIRAGLVTKMLFPGTAGPGWIVVLATPLYTLFVFTLLIVPYQMTGSGWYVGAMLSLAAAQIAIGRAGYALTKPATHDEAVARVAKARAVYLLSIIAFAVCMLAALGSLAKQLGVGTIITTALSFETNVLILTLIGSDLVITGLERARRHGDGTDHLIEDSEKKLAAFASET